MGHRVALARGPATLAIVRSSNPPVGWRVTETSGAAADLHDRPVPVAPRPEIWIHHVVRPALVLGSTQDPLGVLGDIATPARASPAVDTPGQGDREPGDDAGDDTVEICRRRSGGGLVSLLPGNDLWIDLVLPATSDLWLDDVGLAADWVGRTWAAALTVVLAESMGGPAPPVEVHRGPLLHRPAGRLVCFAGLGPGEVTVGGAKVVGVSQRRTRTAARFQTVMTWTWPGRWLAPRLSETALEAAGLDRADIVSLPAGLPRSVVAGASAPTVAAVRSAFLTRVPEP